MKFHVEYLIIALLFLNTSCSKEEKKISIIEEESLEMQMIKAYEQGLKELERGDAVYAAKKFNEAELLYPQSDWAPRSSLMASYAYWSQGYYNNSILELKRFLKVYPKSKNLDYAYYLLAMNYYDSIVDEKKDLRPLKEAKKYFTLVINNYPKTDYALDGKYKIELIQDILAAKEMYIARHYIKKEKWIAAVNRLKVIVEDYDTTIYIEEALHRLVEIHYKLGLVSEAKKYANTLGYNYLSSQWYKESYRVFNKNYKIERKTSKKDKKRLRDRIRSFF